MNMTEKQTEKALEILNYYGDQKQRRQLVEECAELIQAVTKLERAQESGDIGKITEKTLELVGELVDGRIESALITSCAVVVFLASSRSAACVHATIGQVAVCSVGPKQKAYLLGDKSDTF